MSTKLKKIKSKGFDIARSRGGNEEYNPISAIDYNKIKVGLKSLSDPLTDINFYTKVNPRVTKENVLRAISTGNLDEMRAFSEFFYKTSGIYRRLCNYEAFLYKYDNIVTPVVLSKTLKAEKIIEGFSKSLSRIDNFNPKKRFGEIALKVLKSGCYYGYKVDTPTGVLLQDLPIKYCRSRFTSGHKPVVEFNMRYFDDTFSDTAQKLKIIKIFPPEFTKGYILYKEGKLPVDFAGDQQGWYLLDVANTVKFNLNGDDYPSLVSVIPAIIDLEEAQEIDRTKMKQQLLRIIIQKMPIDKNGELIFDVDEARVLHNNAVSMLGAAIGINVLTTFADVDVADLTDKSTTTSVDELMKVERNVFNEAGVSQNQFNTDGNMALEKSIANDEASMFNLITQFQLFLNEILAPFNGSSKKLYYRAEILGTTIYNYQALSKLYKEQMALGFSKILPQIALGQSQSSILAIAYFENEVLNLNELFTPPASSATTSGETKTAGRPPKPDDEKSDKTIQNKESMS